MKKQNRKWSVLGRRGLASLLVAVMVMGFIMPVYATGDVTEPTEPVVTETTAPTVPETTAATQETTEPASSETTEPVSSETTEPASSETSEPASSETSDPSVGDDASGVPDKETVPDATVPQQNTPAKDQIVTSPAPDFTAYDRYRIDLAALEEEAKSLEATEEVLDEFYDRLFAVINAAQDEWEKDTITNEEMDALNNTGYAIMLYLKDTYGYENGEIVSYALNVPTVPEEKIGHPNATVKLFNYGKEINSHPDIIKNPNSTRTGKNSDGIEILYGKYEFYNTYNDAIDGYLKATAVFRPNYDDIDQTLSHTNLRPMQENEAYPGGKFPEQDFDVAPLLKNGYPELTSWPATENPTSFGTMAYLFKENVKNQNGVTHVATMEEGGGLFQLGEDGYYEYHAQKNAAFYDSTTNKFVLSEAVLRPSYYYKDNKGNEYEWVTDGVATPHYMGHFLPFNSIAEVEDAGTAKTSADGITSYALPNVNESLDMWFGMTVEFDFVMTKDGKAPDANGNLQDMMFMFEGDDDVLVYVDDVLILNIAGMHSPQDAWVNFATGQIYDQHVSNSGTLPDARTTIKERFAEAGKTDASLFKGDTLADYTTHTLKFFYLERGSSLSGCRLRFNLQTLPANSVTVAKDVKNGSEDTQFQFRATLLDSNKKPLEKVEYYLNGEKQDDPMTLKDGGIAEFSLADGDYITFDLSAGCSYVVEELDADKNGYVTTPPAEESGTLNDSDSVYLTYVNTLQPAKVITDKKVSEVVNDEIGDYTLTLEAYTKGYKTVLENTVPADIVLVVDHSGSMYRAIDGIKLKSTELDPVKGAMKGYYVAQTKSDVIFLFYEDNKWKYWQAPSGPTALDWNHALPDDAFEAVSDVDADPGMWERLDEGDQGRGIYLTRYGATYDALTSFINETVETAKDKDINHRIAVVGFAKSDNDGTGIYNGEKFTQYQNLTASDYSSAFKSVLNEEDVEALQASIAKICTKYAYTDTALGIEMANSIFNSAPIEPAGSRSRVMIVMTDGKASLGPDRLSVVYKENAHVWTPDEMYEKSAECAISEANKTKTNYEASVYVIGALAQGETLANDTCDRMSSNFLDATTHEDGTRVNTKYYANALNSTSLENIFETVSTDITGASIQLNEYVVLRDTISEYFVPSAEILAIYQNTEMTDAEKSEAYKQYINVSTAVYTGEVDGKDTFSTDKVTFNNAIIKVYQKDGRYVVDVSGFDYSGNYVQTETTGPRGKKLIVEIPIEIAESNTGGNKQPTNIDEDSGIYDEDKKVEDFDLPHVDTPVDVTVKKKVTGNMGDWNKEFTFTATVTEYTRDATDNKYYDNERDSQVGNSNYLEAKDRVQEVTYEGDKAIKLKNGESELLDNLYYGSTVTITEAPENYTLEQLVAFVDADGDGEYDDDEERIATEEIHDDDQKLIGVELTATKDMVILFTNDYEVTIETGIALDSLPYILIIAIVAVGGAVLFLRKRKVED